MNAVPRIRRLWGVIKPGSAGREVIELTAHEPDVTGMSGVLLLNGMIAGDKLSLSLDLVSDPAADPDLAGPAGPNGWTPVLQAEADGTRTLVKIADWVRSAGKPAVGYLTAGGALASDKAAGFNFNAAKRVLGFSGVSNAQGVASITFGTAFANSATAPQVLVVSAVPNLPVGGIKAEIVAGSIIKTGCQVKVTGAALLSSTVTALAGATANVIAIEA